MSPPPPQYRALGDRVERTLIVLVRVGLAGLGLGLFVFSSYLVYAFGTGRMDIYHPLASLGTSVPAQTILAFTGISICLMNSSLVCYAVVTGVDDLRSGLVVVFGGAGFGFGAGLIKLTSPLVVNAALCS